MVAPLSNCNMENGTSAVDVISEVGQTRHRDIGKSFTFGGWSEGTYAAQAPDNSSGLAS